MPELKLTIKIPSEKVDDLKNGFLKAVEKPKRYQHFTDEQFFKQWIKDSIFAAYKTGKIMIAQETTTPSIDSDIVDVT